MVDFHTGAEELAARPKAIEKFRKALALAKKNATEVWPDERPWLEQEDLDALVKKADDAGAWLDDQEKAQNCLLYTSPSPRDRG